MSQRFTSGYKNHVIGVLLNNMLTANRFGAGIQVYHAAHHKLATWHPALRWSKVIFAGGAVGITVANNYYIQTTHELIDEFIRQHVVYNGMLPHALFVPFFCNARDEKVLQAVGRHVNSIIQKIYHIAYSKQQ